MIALDNGSSNTTPILYSFRRCPYAMRARMALAVSSVVYVIREVSLRDKPAALLAASPKGTVPVLVLSEGRVIDQSLDIMRWALGQGDPQQWLAVDPATEAMMAMIAVNDGPFVFHLARMKYASRYPEADPAEHRAQAVQLLAPLEARLHHHCYLFGDAPTLADLAIFPFVRQFAHADDAALAALPIHLQAWLARWEATELFQSVMIKYPEWQPDHEPIYVQS